ncbi:Fis family transcriptional regulator [Streptomyces sp. NPDC004610]|uniref:pPIWI_RE_Y domain-containing protein n=1 Tax=unclassified Streptomyces TaxID=2593676 RepID=UPI0033B72487
MQRDRATPAPAWSELEGIRLLRGVATALVRLGDSYGTESLSHPYPTEAQQALDTTVLACLLLKADPPESLPDLIEWAADRPVEAWPFTLPADAIRFGSRLLDRDTRQPTQLCYEWAVDGERSAALSEQPFMTAAARRCREEDYPEAYQAFRRLLIRRPVLTDRDLVTLPGAPLGELEPLRDLLRDIYQPVPASYIHSGRGVCTACDRCGTLLHPTTEGGMWCERPICQKRDSVRAGREYRTDHDGGVHLLIRPLRQWVSAPGIQELQLARRMAKAGADVELWPDYGAYGMRVLLADGTAWAVEHKDWTTPALLGRRAAPPGSGPPHDRCVWVVPAARLSEQPNFRATFERYRQGASPLLMSDRELVLAIREASTSVPSGRRSDASGTRSPDDEPTGALF